MTRSAQWYNDNADAIAETYERVSPDDIHSWLIDLLPGSAGKILDVGAGSGRDAAWLAAMGHDVVAIEPSSAMRKKAQALHPDSSILWLSDSLPELRVAIRSGLTFDFILLSAVWMHVPPSRRKRAFGKLVALLKPGGVIAITLREGPDEHERGLHPASPEDIERLARSHGAYVGKKTGSEDQAGRRGVRWTQIAIRLPDDGTGALPLLRHVILNDRKTSTYKLGLLRALCRISSGAAGLVRLDRSQQYVTVPMGLVALTWLRLYKPLLDNNIPQSRDNATGGERLGFAKAAFRRLAAVSPHDLRAGKRFSSDDAAAVHQALKDAATTIATMPATHITYADNSPIFPVEPATRINRPPDFLLDEAYLSSFGGMRMPVHLWEALQRFHSWVEPALIMEWERLSREYASRQDRSLPEATVSNAMTWADPSRVVGRARKQALQLVEQGGLHCVWSGKRLTAGNLDVDHCFPWSAWPCDDLWNLMPSHRRVNQNEKRDLLPPDRLLQLAQDRILSWWDAAYQKGPENPLAEQFQLEATASLPGIMSGHANLDDIFAAVTIQRIRLKHDQQVPEWTPPDRYLR